MPAKEVPLTIEQGATWSHGWRVTYNGDPIDDTWTAQAQVRKQRHSTSTKLYDFLASVDDTGAVVVAVPPDDSEAWEWTFGYYDVEVTPADESVRLRVAQGSVTVSREVTRG